MTDFDEVTRVWHRQAVRSAAPHESQSFVHALKAEAARRRRLTLLAALLVGAALAVWLSSADFAPLRHPRSFVPHSLLGVTILLYCLRRISARRTAAGRPAESIRDSLRAEHRRVDAEVRDLRRASCAGALLMLFSLLLSPGPGRASGSQAAARLRSRTAIGVLAGAVALGYYYTITVGHRRKIEALLAQLSED